MTAYKLKGKLEFLGVKVDAPEHCILESGETLLTEALVGKPNLTSTELTVEPEAVGGSFATLVIKDDGTGKCPVTVIGTNKVKGTATGTIVNSGVDLLVHKVQFKAKEPCTLKFAGDEACIEGEIEGEWAGKEKDAWSGQDA